MCGVIKALLLEPAQVAHRPALLERIDASMLEHEGADLLAMHAQRDLARKTVACRPSLIAKTQALEVGRNSIDSTAHTSGLASTSPKRRTSPSRPAAATAIALRAFATSIPIKPSLYFVMARPPAMRIVALHEQSPLDSALEHQERRHEV